MYEHWVLALVIVATSIGSGVIALMIIAVLLDRIGPRTRLAATQPLLEEAVFLFDDQELLDATSPARALLTAAPMGGTDWTRLVAFLAPRFPGFCDAMATLAQQGRLELGARTDAVHPGAMRLIAEDVNGLARITLIDPETEGHGVLVDSLSHRALEDELDLLRSAADLSPALSWRENAAGEVIWANRAYFTRSGAMDCDSGVVSWPLPHLFDRVSAAGPTGPRRMKATVADDGITWFDCYSLPTDTGTVHFALPADATVRAERSLREFVQTLTKTFADLPIGLAIFDSQRQLQLFNPALIDLTQLGPDFLSARPTLYAFLDRLREARMMPEPKDYRSWRQQMTELEQASAAGFHAETWSLPSGQTYRVTGRPHPDGAIAFLFEDISSEVSLTRRFRADLELGHEVLEAMDEAVAVFQPSGDLVISNAAFSRLWGFDPSETLGRVTVMDAVRVWQEQSEPSPIWAAARDYATRIGQRPPLPAQIRLRDGREVACRFVSLNGGATLASFRADGHAGKARADGTVGMELGIVAGV